MLQHVVEVDYRNYEAADDVGCSQTQSLPCALNAFYLSLTPLNPGRKAIERGAAVIQLPRASGARFA